MNYIIDFIAQYPRTVLGLMIASWGLGVITVSIAWAIQKGREMQREVPDAIKIITSLLQADMNAALGHVIDIHPSGEDTVHAHCLCGKMSLDYKLDDPTRDSLLEQWAEEHIESLMESADV